MPPVAAGCLLQFVYCMYVNIEQYEKKTVGMAMASVVAAGLNFVLNFIFKQDRINSNLFYILTSLLVFIVIIFVCIRAICDKGMLLNKVMGYGINFNYFSDFIIFMEIMLYGLIVSNLCSHYFDESGIG